MRQAQSSNKTVLALSVTFGIIFLGIVGFMGFLILGKKKTKSTGCKDSSTCGDGFICTKGECEAFIPPEPPQCELNKPVQDCNCWPPLSPRMKDGVNMCVKADVNEACLAPEVKDALKRLVSDCLAKGGQGLSCKPSDWQQFAIKDETFDQIMSNFPGAVTVHFPGGRPVIGDNFVHWPPSQSYAHYVELLQKNKKAFDDAKRIFVIGRASKGGASPEQNLKYGAERMDFAKKVLIDVYKDGGDAALDALKHKILNFTLGQDRQITAPFFAAHFLPHAITWDDVSLQDLTKTLNAPKAASEEKQVIALNIMNQVSFLIPIPCDGSEGN